MPRTFLVVIPQKTLINQKTNADCRRLADDAPLSGRASSFDTETGGGNSPGRKPNIMNFAIFSSRMHLDVWNAIVKGMCIAPMILGSPFFQTAAHGDPVATRIENRSCAAAGAQYTASGGIGCFNNGANSIKCVGATRVYSGTRNCGAKPAPGIICVAIEIPEDYVEYPAAGAKIANKSAAEIALCLGWDQGGALCVVSAATLITGLMFNPVTAVVTIITTWTGLINPATVVVGCGKLMYDLYCNSGCCFMKCLPCNNGKSVGVRRWC
ncbi:MAG: hypothetical protein WCJ21_05120 [Planctomycetota bacterium]